MEIISLEACDPRPSSSSSAAAEKSVYVAVGKEPKESESTLEWAIQNFGGRKLCILHVHQPVNLAPLFGSELPEVDVGTFREMETKIMQKKLDDCLKTCRAFGVRADKVYIEMDSVEEGILQLVEKFKIKVLIMGTASDGSMNMDRNLNEPKSRKARHVRLRAPPFCTIYFICNGRLIFTRLARDGGPSAEGELPTFSMNSRTAEIEALCKAAAYEKLYIEEIRKRISVEQELEKLKDHENIIKETQDQKMILERQIDEIRQQMAYDSELLRSREQERNDLQVKLDDSANLILELRSQSPQDQPRTEPFHFFALSYSETVGATNRFNPSMLLGEYDHGILYKGSLHGTPVTVRSLIVDTHGSSEFEREVEVLSKFRHPNLATLMGANEEISTIVYEQLPNGSLEDRLMCKNHTPPLSWQARTRIVLELCSALIFLHNRRPQSVVHCALRPSCILLDTNFSCKIIGFDFARIISHEGTSTSTFHSNANHAAPASSYTDPEFSETGEASPKSDIFSFGIIVLQLLTGKSAESVIEEVQNAVHRDQLLSVLDDSAGDWPFFKAEQLALVSLRCCEPQAVDRPDLKSDVLGLVEPMRSACGSALSFVLSDPPSYFLCPISYDIMRDPQVAADGHTYEADVLKQWLEGGHNTSPMTNLPLDHYDLIPNLSLRSAISEWREHQ